MEIDSEGSDTLRKLVKRGMIPRRNCLEGSDLNLLAFLNIIKKFACVFHI